MSTPESIKVLVVDDLPDKRLVYQSILEEPGQEIISASSGADALSKVLQHDFAVILLDVNMPVMDGFETAMLIRSRKRSAHTPIIFVTAHTDEVHSLRGYATGGVDYVLTPVVPEILRTKVRVFVELSRKSLQVQRQAEALREMQAREHQRQLRETTERLDLALEAGRMGAFEWDMGPELLSWSQALEKIFDFAPGEFRGLVSDLRERLHPDDREWVVQALAGTVGGDGAFHFEHRIIRRTGEQAWVEIRGRVFRDPGAGPARITGVCMDITERKRAEADQSYLAAIVRSSDDAIVSKSLDGVIASWNEGAERLFGYAAAEAIGRPIYMLVPEDRLDEEEAILSKLRHGERVPPFETVRRRKGGRLVEVALSISPIYDASGRVIGASKVGRDITERKRADAELARYRAHLEELVRERTAEVEASHERLRLADRLASIGTLAAGLGHDMGNLLLPMQMRLSALERMELSAEARQDITAIGEACEYLKRLSRGLRLFALSPEDAHASGDRTDLDVWWSEVGPFLKNALPRSIRFEGAVASGLPAVAISPHMLTQAMYNLVQNAGDAMKGMESGRVRVEVRAGGPIGENGEETTVILEVADTGPGMTEEVLRRCMEPFYTTKTRGISTGLGLALVRGAVYNAGGTIDVQSSPGAGTVFRLRLPVAAHAAATGASPGHSHSACVSLRNPRLAAYVTSVLRSFKMKVVPGPWSPTIGASLVVIDDANARQAELRAFLKGGAARSAVAIGDSGAGGGGDGGGGGGGEGEGVSQVVTLGPNPSAAEIRSCLLRVVTPRSEGVAS